MKERRLVLIAKMTGMFLGMFVLAFVVGALSFIYRDVKSPFIILTSSRRAYNA
jgi:hypothetical protein